MPLSIYKRGKIWHYRGTVAGRLLRGTTGTSDKKTAERFAADLESRQWKGHFDGPGSTLTFAQAAILYLSAEKPDRFVAKVSAYWKDTPVRQITGGAIRQAAIALYPNGSGATRNRQAIVPMQAIINHAASMDLCAPIKVERFPVTKKVKEPVTWEWVQAFMENASPHLGALACFMFLTGCRISEALALRWQDVSLPEARALIMQTKVGAERRPHLPAALVAALANIPSNRNPDDLVFGYSSHQTAKWPWRDATKRAGIKPLTFHSCRHGFATSMLHAGVDPITVARLGGWKDASQLFKTYGHAMADDKLADRLIGTPEAQSAIESGKSKAKSIR